MDIQLYKDCPLYKHGLQIEPGTLNLKPCCWFKNSVVGSTSYADYKNKIELLDLTVSCKKCIDADTAGRVSPRQRHVDFDADPKLGMVIDNRCNLECVTCDTSASVKLIPERKALQWITNDEAEKHKNTSFPSDNRTSFLSKLTVDFVDDKSWSDNIFVILTGGEILKSNASIQYLENLVASGVARKVHLHIITNGTVSLNKISDTLSSFRSVRINFSIDGIDDVFNFMRYGADFQKVKDNLLYELELGRYQIGIIHTSSWMNILGASEFLQWADKLLIAELSLSVVYTPSYFSVDIIPQEIREKIIAELPIPTSICGKEFHSKIVNMLRFPSTIEDCSKLREEGLRRMQQLIDYRHVTVPDKISSMINSLRLTDFG